MNDKIIQLSNCHNITEEDIISGLVSLEEILELKEELIILYAKDARRNRKSIGVYTDAEEYEQLRKSGELFDREKFYLLVDDQHNVLDMSPIVYHFIDTLIGRLYGKIMLQLECRQQQTLAVTDARSEVFSEAKTEQPPRALL